jgi:hypothetical protein
MQDSLDPRDEVRENAGDGRPEKRSEPMAPDREVPLPTAELPSAVQSFLDGEPVSEATLSGAERELALWKKISQETGRRRRMVTPAYIPAQILAKLADD